MGRMRFDPDLAMTIGQKALMAIAILLVTWLLAKAAKWAFAQLVDKIGFLQRGSGTGDSLGLSLGKIVSLFIWLFGLLAILTVLDLDAVAAPINALLTDILGFIPNLIGAGLLLFIGLMIAGIVRDIVITALQTVDLDKWASKSGVENVTGTSAISKTIGTVVYVLIAVPVAIGALGVLDVAAISVPATNMLSMILESIPNIIVAALLLGLGYFIGKFVAGLLSEVLPGLGVDRSLAATGMLSEGRTASGAIARVAQVAIILFFAIAATKQLGFPELTEILDEVLSLGGRVVFGAVVIGVGFLISNLLGKLLGSVAGSTTAASVVRYAAMILFTFMGLQFMGVGEEIVQTAFSALVIGGAVAAALAFGLGGREWAGRQLEKMESKSDNTPM
jgi:hypothetical protein